MKKSVMFIVATMISLSGFAQVNEKVFCNGDLTGESYAQFSTLYYLKRTNVHTGTAYYNEDQGIRFLVKRNQDQLILNILKIKEQVETPFAMKVVSFDDSDGLQVELGNGFTAKLKCFIQE